MRWRSWRASPAPETRAGGVAVRMEEAEHETGEGEREACCAGGPAQAPAGPGRPVVLFCVVVTSDSFFCTAAVAVADARIQSEIMRARNDADDGRDGRCGEGADDPSSRSDGPEGPPGDLLDGRWVGVEEDEDVGHVGEAQADKTGDIADGRAGKVDRCAANLAQANEPSARWSSDSREDENTYSTVRSRRKICVELTEASSRRSGGMAGRGDGLSRQAGRWRTQARARGLGRSRRRASSSSRFMIRGADQSDVIKMTARARRLIR
jgi:hypothetical protein